MGFTSIKSSSLRVSKSCLPLLKKKIDRDAKVLVGHPRLDQRKATSREKGGRKETRLDQTQSTYFFPGSCVMRARNPHRWNARFSSLSSQQLISICGLQDRIDLNYLRDTNFCMPSALKKICPTCNIIIKHLCLWLSPLRLSTFSPPKTLAFSPILERIRKT